MYKELYDLFDKVVPSFGKSSFEEKARMEQLEVMTLMLVRQDITDGDGYGA